MPTSIEALLIIFSALTILSILTIKLSVRFGIPSLVLFFVNRQVDWIRTDRA